MSIKQLNASYLLQEDRILLRINTEAKDEFDFLLTRRVALFILAATEHLVEKQLEQHHDPATAKAVADFEKNNLVNTDQQSPDFEAGAAYPLGNQPILVLDVTCGLAEAQEGVEQSFFLDFVIHPTAAIEQNQQANQTINIKMPKGLLLATRILLENLCDQASWGRAVIAPTTPEVADLGAINIPGGSGTIH